MDKVVVDNISISFDAIITNKFYNHLILKITKTSIRKPLKF